MDKEEIKNRIDFNNIKEKELLGIFDSQKVDYLVDFEGNFIYPINPLEMKLIKKIKDLEERIKKLEGK